MHKFKELPGKPQNQPTRFVILPLKPYLVKFIQVDWLRIGRLITNEDIEYTKKVRSRPKKLGRYYFPSIFEDERKRERDLFLSIKMIVGIYFKMEIPKSCDYSDFKIQIYKNRTNLSADLTHFIEKKYSLVKIAFPVYTKAFPKNTSLYDLESYNQKVQEINQSLNDSFYRYIRIKNSHHKNYRITINEVFDVLVLNEQLISKESIRRTLSNRKKNELSLPYWDSLMEDSIHIRISNVELFEIYRDHIEHNLSYSQLSEKYSHHKSKISRICTNKDVIKLYEEVSFDHEKFHEWRSEKLAKLFSQNETE